MVVNLNGITVDGQIVFNGSEFTGCNRFGESYPMQFKVARFEAINADVNYLAGNIESYSPYTKEPGYPCYVVMSRLKEKSAQTDTTKTQTLAGIKVDKTPSETQENKTLAETEVNKTPAASQQHTLSKGEMAKQALDYYKDKIPVMTVYPNPFKNEINVTYKTSDSSGITLYIYNANGSLIIQKSLGTKPTGTYTEKVSLDPTPGQYVVRLVIGTEAYAQIIIKQ